MERKIGRGRAWYRAERAEWATMLRELADAYPATQHPFRHVGWRCEGDTITVALRWKWWERESMTAYVTHNRQKGDRLHISTNYPVGLPAIFCEGAFQIEQAMPERLTLRQDNNTAWWVLTLHYNSGMMPADSIE